MNSDDARVQPMDDKLESIDTELESNNAESESSDLKLESNYGKLESNDEEEEPDDVHPDAEGLPKWLSNIRIYRGIRMSKNQMLELEEIEKMEVREDDIWVCSFPRSGTLLTQELVYLVQTLDFERANSVHLDKRFPLIDMFVEDLPFFGGLKMVEALPSPRFIKCHLHHFLLPEQLRNGKGKIIYTARNVRDSIWSLYRLLSWIGKRYGKTPFEEYFEQFMAANVPNTPWSLHVRQYWENRSDGNILYLHFEETVKDMPGAVKKIAAFLNRTLKDEDVKKICEHCYIENMKKNEMTNFSYYKKFRETQDDTGDYINTGTGGSWRGHITDEMNQRIDEMIKTDLAGSGLTYFDP